MKFTILTLVLGLFGLTSAAPADLDAGAKHAARATSAEVTKFSVSCSASSCSYTARAVILPENVAVTFTHTTAGSTIPKNTGFFDSSDPAVYFHINRATDIYRIVLSDAHVVGSAVNLAIITPGEDWTAKSYTGPSSFTLC
ncbi:hypothetical protein QBC40DRAFT_182959 [Triangularia verruculosa]|uniref:Uncharacterized protein n=1 Tax=Triangularia verruculosa TaxID=2587418 RepID=A0AAN6XAH7_9PEZI|nr:hypothetical protein QBC40DRAFT_182959 [Triangularia verruculosa]